MTHLNLEELKAELEEEAKTLGLSLTAYIKMLLINRPKILFEKKEKSK